MTAGTTPASNGTIVDVRELEKVYGGWSLRGRRRVDALRGVSLQASTGEVFGLLGPNGAGKTTLIKILLGVVKPTRGGASLFQLPVGSAVARSRVGYLPESLSIDSHHTARSALRYYGLLSRMSSSQIAKRSDELLQTVGLAGRDRESVRRFSKGMRQRLGLAQALMHDPDLLVLDEPTDGLDPVGRSEVRRVIERLRDEGKTIFLNSHILQEVELVCSRVAIMAKGTIRGSGRLDELAGDEGGDRVVIGVTLPENERGPDPSGRLRSLLALPELDAAADNREVEALAVEDLGEGRHAIGLRAPGQSTIDRLVDQLRAAGISISSLEVRRPSLEDTFIRLVGDDSALESVRGEKRTASIDPHTGEPQG